MTLKVDLRLLGKPVDTMKLRVYSNAAKAALDTYTSRTGQEIELYAKANHPWTNRTGNAERGLHADVTTSANGWSQTVTLSHGSDIYYGYYLENSMGKRFAVIEPTMRRFQAKLTNDLSSVFSDIIV